MGHPLVIALLTMPLNIKWGKLFVPEKAIIGTVPSMAVSCVKKAYRVYEPRRSYNRRSGRK